MGRLDELARNGGYVWAQCRNHKPLLIGRVRPNSRIELLRDHLGGKYPVMQGREAIMKALQLDDVREVMEVDHPSILVGRPPQGTICRR